MKNNWMGKVNRTINSVLPISKDRGGSCKQCGACCSLPVKCVFLKKNKKGFYCAIYHFRILGCRSYPRVKEEWLTKGVCGYNFNNKDKKK
ncbi:MAG: hypothetical protein WC758_00835 [Candidatus Woesearchaeota archaeon]|jgi:Fe-S-cluster containining protein